VPQSGRGVGPAGLLKKRTSWLDAKVVFATKDDPLEAADMALWKISKKGRARQGELGLTDLALSDNAGIQRQTLASITLERVGRMLAPWVASTTYLL
jgi:hypothetical protein